ncbi:MAG: hypothetical protein H5T74_00905 [Actinobacteria bacterium]|nr:hypothetical protein [Actinomycetota bacterium]
MKGTGALKRYLSVSVTLILLLSAAAAAMAESGAASAGAGVRAASAADMTILGLDARDYSRRMVNLVPLSERQWVRHHKVVVKWSDIHRAKDTFDFSYYDREINARLADGAQSILLLLQGPTPGWARDPAYGSFSHNAPPRDWGDWYAFCSRVAERYGGVVDFYEIWNEPGWDQDAYAYRQWGVYHFGGQVETDYLPMLQTAYAAIKEKDPSGQVMCGALICTLDPNPNTGAELTVRLYDEVNRPGQDVSMKVTSSRPIVAERPMYFNYKGAWDGGHNVLGATEARKEWYFAEGTTREGFEEWLCLQNPNPVPIDVTMTFMFGPGQGDNQPMTFRLDPTSRTTFKVNDLVGPGKDVSVKIVSSSDFIAERPMYFNYQGVWTGGHDVVGATAAGREWFFAEGTTRDGFEEWLCLQNPNPEPIDVTMTFMFGPGQGDNQPMTFRLDPTSRTTFKVNDLVGPGKDVSVKIVSSSDFIAERPMYFNYQGVWTGGHCVVGARSSSDTWYFAEGCTGFSIQQYLCLQNPHPEAVTAEITFMMTKGEVIKRKVELAPTSRTTFDINMLIGFHGSSDMLAIHPYKDFWKWGEHYAYFAREMRSHNIWHEVAVTEIGTPHHSDNQPGLYNESMQAEAIGSVGVGALFGAGCRKIWIYRDIDEEPGTSWDHVYYGLFEYTGEPHPSWSEYKRWQQQLPSYPNLPSSL